ncbi:MAG: hypothetical protein R3E98_15415 [Gemmatimonadota bacterium]
MARGWNGGAAVGRSVRRLRATALGVGVSAMVACGGGDGGPDPTGPSGPDPAFAPLVGQWRAATLVHRLLSDTTVVVDVVQSGGRFDVTFEADGDYSVELVYLGVVARESGEARVAGDQLFLRPVSPAPGPEGNVTLRFAGARMIWDGTSRLDFNGDGISESTQLHVELEKR